MICLAQACDAPFCWLPKVTATGARQVFHVPCRLRMRFVAGRCLRGGVRIAWFWKHGEVPGGRGGQGVA